LFAGCQTAPACREKLLDFAAATSVHAIRHHRLRGPLQDPLFQFALADRLREVALLTIAACAEAGGEDKAVQIIGAFESDPYEADRLHAVVALFNQIQRERMNFG
jgi:hypothetical protein